MNYIKLSRTLDLYTHKYSDGENNQFPDDLISIILDYTGDLNKGYTPIHSYRIDYHIHFVDYQGNTINGDNVKYVRFCDKCNRLMGSTKNHLETKTHKKNITLNKNPLTKQIFKDKCLKYIKNNKFHKELKKDSTKFDITIQSISYLSQLLQGHYYC